MQDLDLNNRELNLFADSLFKFVFAKDERKDLTIELLNAVLGYQEQDPNQISDLQFITQELSP